MTLTERITQLEEIKSLLDKTYPGPEGDDNQLLNDVLWIGYAQGAIAHQDDILSISFDIDADPCFVAAIVKLLVQSNYSIEIFEPYYISNDGETYWGEQIDKHKEADLRSHYCN
jgi:hypothetical protein